MGANKCQTFDLFPELFTDEKPNDDCEYARIYGLKNKQRLCSIIWLRMHCNLVRATTLLKWKFEIANNNRLSINLNIKTITRGGLTQVYMYIFAHDDRDQEWLATSDWMPLLAIPNGELVERVQTGQRGFEHQFRQRRMSMYRVDLDEENGYKPLITWKLTDRPMSALQATFSTRN